MNLGIESQVFIVTGASSGLGRAVADRMAQEKAHVIVVARRKELLEELRAAYPGLITAVAGDIRDEAVLDNILAHAQKIGLHGVFVNAGGPPAKKIAETNINDWDEAYRLIIRWKIQLVKKLLPLLDAGQYGRIVFSESSSIKQPVDNLVLSNSLRLSIAGFSKTLAGEYAHRSITSNLIAPGFHETDAVDRLFKKRSELQNIPFEEAKQMTIHSIPALKMGNPSDFASLAAWLLSPLSGFVTGQVFSLDGGDVKATL
jgi:3-oxoacyl-[acyl-carrier protein] reductase